MKNKVIQLRMDEDLLKYIDSFSFMKRSETIRFIIMDYKNYKNNYLNLLEKNKVKPGKSSLQIQRIDSDR